MNCWEKEKQKACDSCHFREDCTFRTHLVGGFVGMPRKQSIDWVHSKEVAALPWFEMCLQPHFPQRLKTAPPKRREVCDEESTKRQRGIRLCIKEGT